jgi:hypothetical protein
MKRILNIYLVTILWISSFACTKQVENADLVVAQNMIQDKTWYLDYYINGSQQKTYTGQATYFINFLKNLTTKDSEGVTGIYSFSINNNNLLVHVIGKTYAQANAEYFYTVESIGQKYMVMSAIINGTTIKYYYSSRD